MKCLRSVEIHSISSSISDYNTTARCGVNVPAIRMVDAAEGVIGIEWIDGQNVRTLLGGTEEGEVDTNDDNDESLEDVDEEDMDSLKEYGITKGEFHDSFFLFFGVFSLLIYLQRN